MSTDLPEAARRYLDASNRDDTAGVVASFAPDATVLDEGHDIAGRAAIAAWHERASQAVKARVAVREVTASPRGVTARAEVSGNFPGSPVMLDFLFIVGPAGIERLEVTP